MTQTLKKSKPALALSMGDPAGIGPEVLLKSLAERTLRESARWVLFGDLSHLLWLNTKLGTHLSLRIVSESFEYSDLKALNVVCMKPSLPRSFKLGQSNLRGSLLAFTSLKKALESALKKQTQGLVTPPINKEAMNRAGVPLAGHTEYLASRSKTSSFAMMLAGKKVRVSLVTRHLALQEVAKHLSVKAIYETILLTYEVLKRGFSIPSPRIAVCGLNPHAGEGGLFGREEAKVIAPAIRQARKQIPHLSGPHPADSLFFDLYRGLYDAAVVMYHDQGLIPLKMVEKGRAVNLTLGLPFVRTSPDHGTAYDIAPQFKASPESMKQAMRFAVQWASKK